MKRLRLLASAIALLLNPSIIRAEVPYELVSERLYVNKELKTKDIDLYAAPIYSLGELKKEDVLARIGQYFGKEVIFVPEKEEQEGGKTYNIAEYYTLSDTTYWLNVFERLSFTDFPKIDVLLQEETNNPYVNLTNYYIELPNVETFPASLSNQALSFMSFAEAEQTVQDFLQPVFAGSNVTFKLETRSMNRNEMSEYIDYTNVNKLKGEDYIGDFKDVYFGQITGFIGNYPIYWHTQGSETFFDGGASGSFALTEDGIQIMNFYNFTPVGTEVMKYPKEEGIIKLDTVEPVLSMVIRELERNVVPSFSEATFYVENVQLVYVPMKMSSFSQEKRYYPVWEVTVKEEDTHGAGIQRIFIDPEGKVWY